MTNLPFCPSSGATTGRTRALNTSDGSAANTTLDCSTFTANNLLVQADAANTEVCFVRLSAESAPTAVIPAGSTLGDLPLMPGASFMIQNPVSNGTVGVSVVSGAAATIYVTPGEGGF